MREETGLLVAVSVEWGLLDNKQKVCVTLSKQIVPVLQHLVEKGAREKRRINE